MGSCSLSFVHSSEVDLIMKLCLLALVLSLAFLLSQKLKPRATQSHIMVIEATTEDTEDTTEAGGDERDGLLTPSLKQLKPQFPDPHQTLKLNHIMVMDMDMAIHITDITGEERSGQLKHLK